MVTHHPPTEISQPHSKAVRIGKLRVVIDTIRNRELTREEIAAECELSVYALDRVLPEFEDYGILRVPDKAPGSPYRYRIHNTGKIEDFKTELFADPQASD